MPRIAIDTSVIIDYIDQKGFSHPEAVIIFEQLRLGNLLGFLAPITLSETYYVSYRIYETINNTNPHLMAQRLIRWLYAHPALVITDNSLHIIEEAAKAKLDLRLASSDCYVLAASKIYKAKAIFKMREREMEKKLESLMETYEVVFLEDF